MCNKWNFLISCTIKIWLQPKFQEFVQACCLEELFRIKRHSQILVFTVLLFFLKIFELLPCDICFQYSYSLHIHTHFENGKYILIANKKQIETADNKIHSATKKNYVPDLEDWQWFHYIFFEAASEPQKFVHPQNFFLESKVFRL